MAQLILPVCYWVLTFILGPCYNEQETISLFFRAVENVVNQIDELNTNYWFIDDGSSDGTLEQIKKLNLNYHQKVHYVSFSRNFGKEAALYAGLTYADGDYIVVMDADLQDPPSLLTEMYKTLKSSDFDCIGTKRTNREGEPHIRSFFANQFYRLINMISSTNIVNGARDYRMMKRRVVDAVLSMKEYNRFSKGIFSWVGFKTKYINYYNVERVAGKTSWSFRNLFQYSIDGITDFSEAPLSLASWTGFVSFLLAICGLIFIVIRAVVIPGSSVSGWASLACVILLLGGLQLLCLGIVGKYIGKIYLQSKRRPIFIVKEKK